MSDPGIAVDQQAPPTSAGLDPWLDYIARIHPREIEMGLGRVGRVASRLALAKPATTVITVAGTNGKGSTVKTLEAMLEAAGFSTGAYTSPHILRFNERIRLRAEDASDAQIVASFARIEAARGADSLSYFEFTTLAALLLFADSGLDFALLEVGLGGRLDAVNLIDPDLCVITNISLDHEDWLGKGRENIGAEKAGILRRGVPFLLGDRDPPASVLNAAQALGIEPLRIGQDFAAFEADEQWSARLVSASGGMNLTPLRRPYLMLDNVVVALQALASLGVLPPTSVINEVLSTLSLAGRFERRIVADSGCGVVLDVAHNPGAAEALAQRLRSEEGNARLHMVFAVMADKAVEDIVRSLESLVDIWYIAHFDGERAQSAQGLEARILDAAPAAIVRRFESVERAFCAACEDAAASIDYARCVSSSDESAAAPLIVVTGSFHTLAEITALPSLLRPPPGH